MGRRRETDKIGIMRYFSVYTTANTPDEAKRLGRRLVEERLAACVNIIDGVRSIYRWEGALQEDDEALLFAKTTDDRVDAVIDRIRELHSYDCPCIVAFPIEKGHPEYLAWLGEETR